MTSTVDFTGYFASTMVFLAFMTKDMRVLRVLAIFSNFAFISYGVLAWLPPVLFLHSLLLPINLFRLHEMMTTRGRRPTEEFAGILRAAFRVHGRTAS
jgi:hypothetical protein